MAFHFDATAETHISLTGQFLEALVQPLAADDVLMVTRMLSLIYPHFPPNVQKQVSKARLENPGNELLKPKGISDRNTVWENVEARLLATRSGNVKSAMMSEEEVSEIQKAKMLMTCEYTRLAGPGLLLHTVIWEMMVGCRLGFAATIHALKFKIRPLDLLGYAMNQSPSEDKLVHTALVYGSLFDTKEELMDEDGLTCPDEEERIDEPDLPEKPQYSLGYNYMIRLHNAITNPALVQLKTAIREWAVKPRKDRGQDDSVIMDLLDIENGAPETTEVNMLIEYMYEQKG